MIATAAIAYLAIALVIFWLGVTIDHNGMRAWYVWIAAALWPLLIVYVLYINYRA